MKLFKKKIGIGYKSVNGMVGSVYVEGRTIGIEFTIPRSRDKKKGLSAIYKQLKPQSKYFEDLPIVKELKGTVKK